MVQDTAAGFFPSKFDADQWVSLFKESGAGYVTVTSRHHDGFSMFRAKASPFNIVDATPFKRDVIGELAEACHKVGLKIHLYYSKLDWGREDYPPLGSSGQNAGRLAGGEWNDYLNFMDAQLTELLTHYGEIAAIWFDGMWDKHPEDRNEWSKLWNIERQYALIHSLQPSCLVGCNHHSAPFPGEDIQIFEKDLPGENQGSEHWENGCPNMAAQFTTLPEGSLRNSPGASRQKRKINFLSTCCIIKTAFQSLSAATNS